MAIVQLFFRASAIAAVPIFLASLIPMDMPYAGAGGAVCALAAMVVVRTMINERNSRIARRCMLNASSRAVCQIMPWRQTRKAERELFDFPNPERGLASDRVDYLQIKLRHVAQL